MNFLTVILIGVVLGVLDGVGIFFEPKEPYKWQILCAATLKGVLVTLLTAFSLSAASRWWSAMVTGALYGLAFGLVIYLAKGGPLTKAEALRKLASQGVSQATAYRALDSQGRFASHLRYENGKLSWR